MLKNKTINGKHLFLYLCIFNIIFLLFSCLTSLAFSKDEQLNVKRDNEKTVYSIGSSDEKREQDKDKENAWEMLKNKNMWIQPK